MSAAAFHIDWAARSWRPSARDWTEDSGHENGNYVQTCILCRRSFKGHKRRVGCKQCATQGPATQREGEG